MKVDTSLFLEEVLQPGAMRYKGYSCVYCCVNKINGKVYVGSSKSLKKRIPKHKYRLNLNKHENAHLQAAYNKYGKDAFVWYIIEECLEERLLEREGYYIDLYGCANRECGYNIIEKPHAVKHSQETIEKIKKARALQAPTMLGKKHTEESRAKMRESHLGQVPWCKGKHLSDETKEKLRITSTGLRHTEEAKNKLSEMNKGRIPWNKGKKDSPEIRKNKIDAQNRRGQLDKDYIVHQFDNGVSAKALAEELKCHVSTIERCVKSKRSK